MLTLYFAPGSSSMAVHIALYEVGTPFEARPISFHRRENRTSVYLALTGKQSLKDVAHAFRHLRF